jgi:hypothetical protein
MLKVKNSKVSMSSHLFLFASVKLDQDQTCHMLLPWLAFLNLWLMAQGATECMQKEEDAAGGI